MTPQAKLASEAFYKTLREKGCRVDAAQLELAWERASEAARTGAAVHRCKTCERVFTAYRTTTKYCSSPCRQEAYRLRQARHLKASTSSAELNKGYKAGN